MASHLKVVRRNLVILINSFAKYDQWISNEEMGDMISQ